MAKGKAATVIGGGKRTTATQFSTFAEMFTPDWDKETAAQQPMSRIARRARMGQKQSLKGAGTLLHKKV